MKRDSEHLTNLHEDMGLRVLSVVSRRRLGLAALGAVVAALALFTPPFVPTVEAQTPANDAATFAVSGTPSVVPEGEIATVTVAISNGVTFTEDQTITLALSGTASSDDYKVKPKSLRLTLPAGESSAALEIEGLDDDEEEEAETVTITATHGGVLIGSATVTITSISHDATLSALSLSGIYIGTFSGAETSSSVYVEEAVETTTVTATASHPEAEVSIDPGTEVRLAAGVNEIVVTVTAEDGFTTETYTVTVFRTVVPFTARFVLVPEAHSGLRRGVSLQIQFSEAIELGANVRNTPPLLERSMQVVNGEVSRVRFASGRLHRWEVWVVPASNEDMIVFLNPVEDCSAAAAVCSQGGKPLSNRPTAIIQGPSQNATGLPTISGTAEVGETLTASASGIADADGLTGARFAWQWIANDETTDTAIAGATDASYTLTSAEAGKTIKVWVTFTDDGGTEETSVSEPTAIVFEPLTASFSNMPESHNALKAFTFDLHFSEDIPGLSYKTVAGGLFEVTGANVTGARRLTKGSNQGWRVTVAPSGSDDISIKLPARACGETAAICISTNRALSEGISATVQMELQSAQQSEGALTARFENVPESHDGSTAFTFELHFSEAPSISWRTVKDHLFDVPNGTVTKAGRVTAGSNLAFAVTVQPTANAEMTITVRGTDDCAAAHAVCTSAKSKLAGGTSATVYPGTPIAVTIADTEVEEAEGATLDFVVTLSRTMNKQITVYYRTYDGTARVGADYEAANGTVVFTPGETEKTVSVAVLDDAHDEGRETVKMWLWGVRGLSAAQMTDPYATGTIVNSDPLQRAWLARFGRTVATHVTDAVGGRLRGSSDQDSYVMMGGYRLPVGRYAAGGVTPEASEREPALLRGLAGMLGMGSTRLGNSWAEPSGGGTDLWAETDPRLGQTQPLTLDLRRILLGSSFRLALGGNAAGAGPRLTAWGRFAGTTFDGRDGDLTLDGDVFTGTVGVDGEWDRLLAGVAVAHSRGDGSFTMPGTENRGQGGLEHTLTSLHPYLRYAVTDRLDVWGMFGYGWGQWDLETEHGETMETDTNLVMGAFGGRGILLVAPESGGFQLATRTDAMLTRTTSDSVAGMVAGEADAHRLRLVLEGSRGFAWATGRRLTPTVELGLRHDWGDAETGFGLELGGRVQYADPALGLTIEGAVRGLLAHEDSDYEEWGASGTVRVDPGASGRGLSLTLSPTWGVASSGVDGLWSRQPTAGLAQNNRRAPAGRLNAEVGYGFTPFDTGLLTPYAGTVLADGATRTYRVGTRLQMTSQGATGLALSLEGTRQEPAGQQPVNQGVQLKADWQF